MSDPQLDTDQLLARAASGDQSAIQELLDLHRLRLRRMVAVNIDPRVSARFDPSDVVQEALVEAYQRLPAYARDRTISFYPWLRQIAWQRLVKLQQKHLMAARRSVTREEAGEFVLPDDSVQQLAHRLASSAMELGSRLVKQEMQQRVRAALEELRASDREVLVMRYLEHMSIAEISETLELNLNTVKKRHTRALERLRHLLGDEP
jgi:RNA polymerase sigma-70 factor (ECF subfamily)